MVTAPQSPGRPGLLLNEGLEQMGLKLPLFVRRCRGVLGVRWNFPGLDAHRDDIEMRALGKGAVHRLFIGGPIPEGYRIGWHQGPCYGQMRWR